MEQSIPGAHVFLVLWKAFAAVQERAIESLCSTALGESDFRVLEVLLHKGAMPVNTIGPKVHLTPGSISVAVNRLHEKGLVSRVGCETDRRVRIVDLTPSGRALIARIFRVHQADMERVVSVLSASERTQLTTLLKKLGRHAESLTVDPQVRRV